MANQINRLIVRTGPNPGAVFDLTKDEMTIGRDPANDIAISELEVSRKHAVLIAQTGGYLLKDLGSTNGTFINGQRLMGPHFLRPGETILLGEKVSLVYETATLDTAQTQAVVPEAVPVEASLPAAAAAEGFAKAPVSADQEPPVIIQAAAPVISSAPETSAAPEKLKPSGQDKQAVYRNWLLIAFILMLVILCAFVVGALLYIDAGGVERWCRFLGFLFPAQCP